MDQIRTKLYQNRDLLLTVSELNRDRLREISADASLPCLRTNDTPLSHSSINFGVHVWNMIFWQCKDQFGKIETN